jgi:bifunctional non-homologous end joining protein LigD
VVYVLVVSNADRVVFPEVGRTKGDVVAYYDRIAPRLLPHVAGRALSIQRFPKGLAGPGFFQKNVPAHYPASIARLEIPRSREASKRHRDPEARGKDVTVYPVIHDAEHLPYLANQGAIELHVPTARADALTRPDRVVIDLDPPPDALALVRHAAFLVRDALDELGLETTPVATGSKGFHLVAAIVPNVEADVLGTTLQQLAALLAAQHPDVLTTVFRVAGRKGRVFVDWLRNQTLATVVAPYSLRARARATVAAPITWSEVETLAPDAFTIDDAPRLLERPDLVLQRASRPTDATGFVAKVGEAFATSGLVLETFDRFRG